ncbi:hypothetical protein [Paraburkholderia rhizosphaerae]|uniref:Lipoprotein n=1 Tax=Paraburkholderia rhizosphaerae TaxID=480658 RepID=A0A4R8LIR5_9BURK|nr:hypothetical protein [Paraburkholderia rhizosphaerae]TDY43324.1 hypothetical protein BX592_118119 [Paraburkholderia rhizosphaerae]
MHGKRHTPVSAFVLVVFLSMLQGCGSVDSQPTDWVSRDWAGSMATYNIFPIYPPSEDVHIGDIYAYRLDEAKRGDGNLFRSVKLDYVSQTAALRAYYDHVPVMPSTSDEPSTGKIWRQLAAGEAYQPSAQASSDPKADEGKGGSDAVPPPARGNNKAQEPKHPARSPADGGAQVRANPQGTKDQQAADQKKAVKPVSIFTEVGTMERLPLVAFPGFTLAHADVESLGGSVPLRFFHALFGASRNAEGSINVKITAAETYGIPVMQAARALANYCKTDIGQVACSTGFLREQMKAIGTVDSTVPMAVSMINRLYVARSIEYTYEASTAEGAQSDLYVNLQKALDNQKSLLDDIAAKSASAVAVAGASAPDQTVGKLTDIKSALDAVLKQIQATNQQFGNSPVPGASFTVGRIDAQGVTLIQIFERPVAIGYRAVTMRSKD